MKALPKLPLMSFILALALGAGVGLNAVSAQEEEEGQAGAKGLFFEQLKKPEENINTGLRYWIELKRGNVVSQVTNKTQFKTGDSIRFHVCSNIDGFAYILLTEGSRAEQSVLFPDARMNEVNRVDRGKEYALPSDGFLTFDNNPGTEKLTLLLSRAPIDAQAYLARPQRQVTMIASAQTGSKDLVPAKIYVSYNAPRVEAPIIKDEPKAEPTVIKSDSQKGEKSANRKSKSEPKAKPTNIGTSKVKMHRTLIASGDNNKREDATVTVVSKQSGGLLHVDVALEHK